MTKIAKRKRAPARRGTAGRDGAMRSPLAGSSDYPAPTKKPVKKPKKKKRSAKANA